MTGRHQRGRAEQVTFDELLVVAEEPAPPPRRSGARFWIGNLVFSTAGTIMLSVVIQTAGYEIPYLLIFAIFFTAAALYRALRLIDPQPLPPATTGTLPATAGDPQAAATDPTDGLFLAMARWDTRLEWTERDPGRFVRVVRARLADVADERLRLRHGITRTGEPEQARQLMGEPLWDFLHRPITRNPTPKEMAAIVAEVERL
jgi:hypothetical protein